MYSCGNVRLQSQLIKLIYSDFTNLCDVDTGIYKQSSGCNLFPLLY